MSAPITSLSRPRRRPAKAEKPKAEKKPRPRRRRSPKAERPRPPKAAPAVVDENADYAAIRAFLTGLLERMGVSADMEISPRDNGGVNVNLTGSAMGAIIGRRGETLDAIQHLTNYVVNKDSDKHLHISVDAEAYRSKREESLTKLAEKMAEKAIKYKRSMALEPMNSYERHVIHTALQNYEGVTTSSTGVEPNRRVVVSYVKPEKPDNKPKSREWANDVLPARHASLAHSFRFAHWRAEKCFSRRACRREKRSDLFRVREKSEANPRFPGITLRKENMINSSCIFQFYVLCKRKACMGLYVPNTHRRKQL